jgi:D-sedoheptulose 7-phosphate isomerase
MTVNADLSPETHVSIEHDLEQHLRAVQSMVMESSSTMELIVEALTTCFENGHKVLICGNGGSAADAQHFAAEFINRMHIDRKPWPTVALTTDTSVLTSIANDSSFDAVFSRQVQALGRPGDTLIGLSTSGTSPSVLNALVAARHAGMTVIGFTGESGVDTMGALCDLLLVVPSRQTPRVQEAHGFAYHVIARRVEENLAYRSRGRAGVSDE